MHCNFISVAQEGGSPWHWSRLIQPLATHTYTQREKEREEGGEKLWAPILNHFHDCSFLFYFLLVTNKVPTSTNDLFKMDSSETWNKQWTGAKKKKCKKKVNIPPGVPGGSIHPPLPAYSNSSPTRTDGVESDLLDSIPPSSDLYAQPICHRWQDFSVVDIGNPLRSIDLSKICSLPDLHRIWTYAETWRRVELLESLYL